jgi:hypothetical protein
MFSCVVTVYTKVILGIKLSHHIHFRFTAEKTSNLTLRYTLLNCQKIKTIQTYKLH